MKRITILLCALISAILLSGCSDKDDHKTPEYKTTEGLLVTTYYEAFDRQDIYSLDLQYLDQFIFYSDTFPVTSLVDAVFTCHCVSSNYPHKVLPFSYSMDVVLSEYCIWVQAENKPIECKVNGHENTMRPVLTGCGEGAAMFSVYISLCDPGDYDFYFTIENPERGIYYRTPVYRYNIFHGSAFFSTTIRELK